MIKDPQSLFPGLQFEESTHTYLVEGEVYPSVSSLISNFYTPFDTTNISRAYAKKHGFTVEEVLQSWAGKSEKSCKTGSDTHTFAENHVKYKYFNIGQKPVVEDKQCLGVVQFWNDLPKHLEPVGLEVQMYSKRYKYCGTADVLLYNHAKGYYSVCDYKTNEKLTDDYNKSPLLNFPKEHGLVQNALGKYSLQFSFYSILLEEAGLNVGSRVLVWLREQENKKLYKMIKTPDVTKDLRAWFENRKVFS